MDLLAELTRCNLDPALLTGVRSLLEQADQFSAIIASRDAAIATIAARDAAIKAANLKIDALTFELAHHRRIRFAAKSEAFSAEQRTLFEETWIPIWWR
jgi:transposase